MKNILISIGLFVAELGGYIVPVPLPCLRPHVDDADMVVVKISKDLLASATMFVTHIEASSTPGTSGEFKRSQALRGMINRHPDFDEHACALAIELALEQI